MPLKTIYKYRQTNIAANTIVDYQSIVEVMSARSVRRYTINLYCMSRCHLILKVPIFISAFL